MSIYLVLSLSLYFKHFDLPAPTGGQDEVSRKWRYPDTRTLVECSAKRQTKTA